MGGKVWSEEEEDVFWNRLMPQSPKRLGADRERFEEKSWQWVAQQMTEIMGDKARREYTHLGVFEHYFQNAGLGRFSPHAGKLPLKYFKAEHAQKKEKEDAQKEKEKKEKQKATKDGGIRKCKVPMTRRQDPSVSWNASIPNAQHPTAWIPLNSSISWSYHGQCPASSPTTLATSAAPALSSPPPRDLMPPQYYIDRFLANHDRDGEESLFVAQDDVPCSSSHSQAIGPAWSMDS